MGDTTKISWADMTFNPWIGCEGISPGCDHCYAEAYAKRVGRDFAKRTRTSEAYWRQPLKWNAAAPATGKFRVFCASLADVFDNQVEPAWRADLFKLIRATPNLRWEILTKRIGNAAKMLPDDWGDGYPNVLLGATVVNQEEFDRDIDKLLAIRAAARFLSLEPLLGPIDGSREYLAVDGVYPFPDLERKHRTTVLELLDWVIAGGESGHGARPAHPQWFRDIRDQCAAAGVPFHFKQWGEWHPSAQHDPPSERLAEHEQYAVRLTDGALCTQPSKVLDLIMLQRDEWAGMCRIGKKAAGHLLDGVEHLAFPNQPERKEQPCSAS